MTKDPFRLDSPLLVQWEYASEERLRTRNEAYGRLVRGVNADDLAFEAVAEVSPGRVLAVGCGTGELAERMVRELGAEVVAVDISGRMVELTAARCEYIAASITRAHLAEDVPEFEGPLETRSAHVVFVAEK